MVTPVWNHFFSVGEFMQRERLLSGLDLAQVTARPGSVPHSIYDELWHTAEWQRIVVEDDEVLGDAWQKGGNPFPSNEPTRIEEWQQHVDKFLRGSREAARWGESLDGRGKEMEPGWREADILASLAMHNAYHMGKIVTLRQMIGAWPPPE